MVSILGKNVVADRAAGVVPIYSNDIPSQARTAAGVVSQMASLKKQIADLDSWIAILDGATPTTTAQFGDVYNITGVSVVGTPYATTNLTAVPKSTIKALKKIYLARRSTYNNQLNVLQTGDPKTSGSGGNGNSGDSNAPTAKLSKNIIYNAPAVKQAYFKNDQSLFNQAGRGDNSVYAGNTPAKVVKDAKDLWTKAIDNIESSKGMIQTWRNPANQFVSSSDSGLTPVTGVGTGKIQRHGFQFIYNPTNVNMEYGGVSDVDPGWAASGREKFLLSNPTVFQSSISVSIFINRMYDMKYLGPGGKLSENITDLYSGRLPTTDDLKKIYNRGTMYDIEFLLQTMFPYAPVKTQLRGKTADVGFLGPMPVELHLGNKLRYLVQINNISVNHAIFDNRMVPIWSYVTISANRIPDAKSGLEA